MCEWETDSELRWLKLGFQGLLPSPLPVLVKRLVFERGMIRHLRFHSLKLRFYYPDSNSLLSIFLWRQVSCIFQADLQLTILLPQPPECHHSQLPSSLFTRFLFSRHSRPSFPKVPADILHRLNCSDTKLLCAHVLSCVLSL